MTGGLNTTKPSACKSTEIFDIAKNTWSNSTDMIEARSAHSICEVGGGSYIYVFGGQGSQNQALDSIERAQISS